jgi:hypothetical protein
MKKGKTSKIIGFDSIKVTYGTVDSKNLKSVYLNNQTWATPENSSDNWNRVVANLSRNIKHHILDVVDLETFQSNYIVDLDLRTSGIQLNKKSFMNLEMTFFMKTEIDFKSNELKDKLKQIAKFVYQENMKKNPNFDFTVSKTEKEFI